MTSVLVLVRRLALARKVQPLWPSPTLVSAFFRIQRSYFVSATSSSKIFLLRFARRFDAYASAQSTEALISEAEDEMAKSKGGFYAVQNGRQKGVYQTWDECEAQTKGFTGSVYKKFSTQQAAEAFAGSNVGYGKAPSRLDGPSGSNYKQARQQHANKQRASGVRPEHHAACPSHAPGNGAHTASPLPQPQAVRAGSYASTESPVSRSTKIDSDAGTMPSAPQPAPKLPHSDFLRPAPQLAKHICRTCKTGSHLPAQDPTQARSIFPSSSSNRIYAYCDGSSIGNGKRGARAGWGVYFEESRLQHLNESRRLPGEVQTNNRAELTALIRAIQLCNQDPVNVDRQLVLMTDSEYSMNCVESWIKGWKRRDWKTSTGKDVQNKDLIVLLDKEMGNCKVRPVLEKVKAHSGIPGNEIVDRMAKFGATLPLSDSAFLSVRSSAPESHITYE